MNKVTNLTDDMYNEIAKELLIKELHRLHPATVKFDDDTGERIK